MTNRIRALGFLAVAAAVFASAGMEPGTSAAPIAITTNSQQSNSTAFSCPMHPDVKSVVLGSCPRCGMRLKLIDTDSAEQESPEAKSKAGDSNLEIKVPDVIVYDQDDRRLNFHADLIKGKTVAINFIFTSCTTICPPLTATMRQIQREIGERVGKDVWLISVSVDPVTDTPERLRSFATKFGAGRGWTFVTGQRSEIDRLLKALGAYVSDKNNHSPIILVGNEPAGYWTRGYGLAPASTIARLITEAAAARAAQR